MDKVTFVCPYTPFPEFSIPAVSVHVFQFRVFQPCIFHRTEDPSVPHLMCWRTEGTFTTVRRCCDVFVILTPDTKLQIYFTSSLAFSVARRGITVLSLSGKVFFNTLLRRIQDAVDSKLHLDVGDSAMIWLFCDK